MSVYLKMFDQHPIAIEAACSTCGEIFNPADDEDLIHIERTDGSPCGGQGVILGAWYSHARSAESVAQQGILDESTMDRPRDARHGVEARIMLNMFEQIPYGDWIKWRKASIFPVRK